MSKKLYVREPRMGNGSGGYRATTIADEVSKLESDIEIVIGFRDRLQRALREAGIGYVDDGERITITKDNSEFAWTGGAE